MKNISVFFRRKISDIVIKHLGKNWVITAHKYRQTSVILSTAAIVTGWRQSTELHWCSRHVEATTSRSCFIHDS